MNNAMTFADLDGPTKFAKILKYIGWFLCGIAFISSLSKQYPLVIILGSTPWLFLIFSFTRFGFSIFARDFTAIFPYLIGQTAVLGGRTFLWPAFDFVDLLQICLIGAGAAVIFTGVVVALFVRLNASVPGLDGETSSGGGIMIAILIVGMLGFGLNSGLASFLNASVEPHNPVMLSGKIDGKFHTTDRHETDYFHISGASEKLASTLFDGQFEVDAARYYHTNTGAKGCVAVHTGLLRLRWYEVVDCKS